MSSEQELIRLALETAAKVGVEKAAEVAARTAIATYKSEVDKNNKSRNDRRLRNTKLLLSHYREFKEFARNAVYSKEQIEESAIDILDQMWDPYDRQEVLVESIKKSKLRTVIILEHVDEMLDIYRKLCLLEDNPEGLRRYEILYELYISEKISSMGEIAQCHNIDKRTAYRDLKTALNRVSLLIFGVDYLK